MTVLGLAGSCDPTSRRAFHLKAEYRTHKAMYVYYQVESVGLASRDRY